MKNIKLVMRSFIILSTFLLFNNFNFGQSTNNVLKKLTLDSEIILIGKVSAKKSAWNDTKTRIYSKVTINPYENLKGNSSGSDVTINVLGGEIDGIGELYTHMAKFENDEEVLIFAKRDKKNKYRITGGELGKMKILRDKITGKLTTASLQDLDEIKSEIKKYIVK